jgi:hypothetical protein
MSSTDKDKGKDIQAKALQTRSSDSDTPKALNLRPLPQNRPVADNSKENTDDLMGYLD